jgi:hypothetical protein
MGIKSLSLTHLAPLRVNPEQEQAFEPESRRVGLASVSRTFSFNPGFFPENEDIFVSPTCGLAIGIYLFYENWSIETLRKNQRSGSLLHLQVHSLR